MKCKYRKTAIIQAEQFDGSIEMMRKYDIKGNPEGGVPLYTITTREGKMAIHEGDWIANGINGEH